MSGAEAAAAFGLAAGVMQVIGFSLQLWDTAGYIRKAGSNITTADCAREADILLKQCEEVKHLQSADNSQLDESVRINEIAEQSCLIIQDIAKSLIRYQIPEGSKGFTRFKDVLINVLWNGQRTDVEALRKTLENLRNELQFQLVISIKGKVDRRDIQQTIEYEKLGSSLQNLVNALLEGDSSVKVQLQQIRQQQYEFSRGVEDILGRKEHPRFVARDEAAVLEELKNRLWFNAMPHRHDAIDEAYQSTFEWVFMQNQRIGTSNQTFVEWMRTDEGFYWVSGRAGTGKSSFMRFLDDDSRTTAAFQKWAGNRPLIIASFYFWNDPDRATDPRLHRLEGIYQGLLYQILQAAPKLAGVLFPDQLAGRDWGSFPTLSDSKAAFSRLLKADILPVAIAMMIDGLDEYDAPHGEQIALARLLRDAAERSHFKILVSSRPEFAFEVAFENCARLELDKLTEGDRRVYVTDSLFKNARFSNLGATPAEQQTLINHIVEKSEGIFLWVRIVVRALEEELYVARNIQSLVTLVDTTPGGDKTLAELFDHIFRNRIRPEFRFRGFQMIWVLQQCHKLPNLLLSTIDFELNHRPLATGTLFSLLQDDITTFEPHPMTNAQREKREKQTTLEMQRYCAGLIETRSGYDVDQEVHFLHKDVSIFLNQPGQMDLIRQTLGLAEPSLFVLLEAFVMMVMAHPHFQTKVSRGLGYYPYQLAEACLILARLTENSDVTRTERALDKLDASMSQFCNSYNKVHYGMQNNDENLPHWAECFPYLDSGVLPGQGLLNFAIQNGLHKYVQIKLQKEPWHLSHKGLPLLSSACAPLPQCFYLEPHPFQARTVEMLLNYGSDPNEVFHGYSHWQRTLFLARDSFKLDFNGLEELAKIMDLLLRHGADPEAKIEWSGTETSPNGSRTEKNYERSAEEQISISLIDRFLDNSFDEVAMANCREIDNYKRNMLAGAETREKFLKIGNELLMLCKQKREQQVVAMPAVIVDVPESVPEPVPESVSAVFVPVTHPSLESFPPERPEGSRQSKSVLKRLRESWKPIRKRKD